MSEPEPVPAAAPVVAGVSDSLASRAAAATAARVAGSRGLPLRLVRAVAEESARAQARTALAAVARDTGAGDDAVTAVVREGPAGLVLLHEARTATLLVVGATSAAPGAAPDSVTAAVVRRSPCPVLVDRPVTAHGTVVVGVTGAPGTAALLAAAAAEAARRGGGLLVLHGWSRTGGTPSISAGPPPGAVDDAERALFTGYVEPLRAQYPGLPVEVRVAHEPPEEFLVRAAADAEVLVVGSHPPAGRSCTAAVVAAAAACPVLVIPLSNR